MSRASWARHERRGASGAVRNGGSGAVRSWSYPFWGLFDTAVPTMPMETRSMRARGRVRSHRKVSRCGLSRHPGTQLRLAAPYRKEVESMNRRIAHAAQIVAFVLALALVPAALAAAGGGPRGGGGSTTSSSSISDPVMVTDTGTPGVSFGDTVTVLDRPPGVLPERRPRPGQLAGLLGRIYRQQLELHARLRNVEWRSRRLHRVSRHGHEEGLPEARLHGLPRKRIGAAAQRDVGRAARKAALFFFVRRFSD